MKSQFRARVPQGRQLLHRKRYRLVLELLEDRTLPSSQAISLCTFDSLHLDANSYDGSTILARFAPGAEENLTIGNMEIGRELPLVPGLHEVHLGPGMTVEAALAYFAHDPNIVYAQPNYRVSVALTPNDALYPQQYALHNTGQTGGTAGDDIDADKAWDISTGSSKVIVAVIDTGVNYTHPDLATNIWINQAEIPASRLANLSDVDADGRITFYDLNYRDPATHVFVNQGTGKITDLNGNGYIDGGDLLRPMVFNGGADSGTGGWKDGVSSDGFMDDLLGWNFVSNSNDPLDDYGHGTHVAGTIGAATNNGIGMAGISWNVSIMPVKFLDSGGGGYISAAIDSLNYAVAHGATISNNSWGGGGFDQAMFNAIQNAATHDHIFVAAAGNDGSNNDASPFYPSGYNVDNVVSVAATDHNDQLAYFSNYGANTVDLGAPGVNILSTLPTSGPLSDPSGYGLLSGTSMATPHVSGVLALVRAKNPTWSYSQVIQQVLGTVEPIPALSGRTITGGRLNAYAALTGQPPPDTTGPRVISSTPSGTVTGSIASVRLTFSEKIDAATFTPADVASFTGPGGAIAALSVTPVAGNARQFDIAFDPQPAQGSYEMVIGPDIADPVGNLMDQNGNGTGGIVPDDQYHARFTIGSSTGFQSTDVPAPLSGLTATGSFLDVDQDVTIGDIDVTLDISYPWDADLGIYIVSPQGYTVYLSVFNGDGADFSNTTFDDEATTPIWGGSPPFAGSYQPDDWFGTHLYDFDGLNARGRWELWVENWGLDDGSLNAWSITIQPAGASANHPPVAVDDNVETDENVPAVIAVLANDYDPDGNPLSIVSVDSASGGTPVINPDNTVSFTPDPGFFGTAGFGYTISDGQALASARVTIPVYQPVFISIEDITVTENGPEAIFTVTLSQASSRDVTVDYTSVPGTAQDGYDYYGTAGTLYFAAGTTRQSVTVSIIDDSWHEGTEHFSINLSNATNSTITVNEGRGTILDNDLLIVTSYFSGYPGNSNWFVSGGYDYLSTNTEVPISIRYSLDGGATQTYTDAIPVDADGTHTIMTSATDYDGNEVTQTFTIKIDTATPTVSGSFSGTPGTNGWFTSAGQFTVTSADSTSGVAGVTYSLDYGPETSYTTPFAITGDGHHVAYVTVTDVAGNSTSQSFDLYLDTAPPTLTGSYSGTQGNNGWFKTSGYETLNVDDTMSGVVSISYKLDGGSWQPYSSSFAVDGNGTHTVVASATDYAGNVTTKTFTIKIDTGAPTVAGSFSGTPGSSGWFRSGGNETLSATDTVSGIASIKYRLDGGALTTYAGAFPITTDGTHTVAVTATDKAGNVKSQSFTIKIDSVAPVVTLSAVPSPTSNNKPTFSGTRGTVTNDSTTVTVKIYSGSSTSGALVQTRTVTTSTSSYSVAATALADGTYTAQAEQTDAAGNKSFSAARTFVVKTAKNLAFSAQPQNALAGALLSPVVIQLTDSTGQPVAQAGVAITLKISSGTLSGTLTVLTDANGRATFSDLRVSTRGTYKLTASATLGGVLVKTDSDWFTIS